MMRGLRMRKIVIGFFVGCGISLIISAGAQVIYTSIVNAKKEPVKMELSIYPDQSKQDAVKTETSKAGNKEAKALEESDEEPSIRVCDGMIQYFDGKNWIDLKTVKELEKAEQEDKARIEAVLLGEKDKTETKKTEEKKTDAKKTDSKKTTASAKQTVATTKPATTTVKPAQTPAADKPATAGTAAPATPTGSQNSSSASNSGNGQTANNSQTVQNSTPSTNNPTEQNSPTVNPDDSKPGDGHKDDEDTVGDNEDKKEIPNDTQNEKEDEKGGNSSEENGDDSSLTNNTENGGNNESGGGVGPEGEGTPGTNDEPIDNGSLDEEDNPVE